MTTTKTKITEAGVHYGDGREFVGAEGQEGFAINFMVFCVTADGRKLVHRTFFVHGIEVNAAGEQEAVSSVRADRFAERVTAAGEIDESNWAPVEMADAIEHGHVWKS